LTSKQTIGEGEDAVTYEAGPYIVTGEGTIAKIGTSAADGSDFASQISAIEGKVATLESAVANQAAQDTTHTNDIAQIKSTSTTNAQSISTVSETVNQHSDKLATIENNAQVNKIEIIKVGNTALEIDADDKSVNIDLSNYALKSDLDSKLESKDLTDYAKIVDVVSVTDFNSYKEEITEAISSIPKFDIEVVNELPTENISESTVYLVKDSDDLDGNMYTEYIYVNGWEILGEQKFDLSGYSTTEEMNAAITTAINNHAASYYTSDQIDTKLNDYLKSEIAESTYVKVVEGSRLITEAEGTAIATATSDIKNLTNIVEKISVTDISSNVSNGIGLTKSDEGVIGISVNSSDLASSLVGSDEPGLVSGISIKLGQDIKSGEETVIAANDTVQTAIETIYNRLTEVSNNKITSIEGDDYIIVTDISNTVKNISLDLKQVASDIVDNSSSLKVNSDGKLVLL